jgi:acyl carrier protein
VLGLDSHGLLRVLLDIEQQLGLKDLDLPDDALVSPATMVTGVTAQV